MSPRGKRITASQVGQYTYCAHAWWLNVVEGQEPANLEALDAGRDAHERHGWEVTLARGASRLALAFFGLALLALCIWAIVSFAR
jgi:hypothetical protein